MRFNLRNNVLCHGIVPIAMLVVCFGEPLEAQRENRTPAATQGFDAAECRSGCLIDTLIFDIDRGRRAQAGVMSAALVLIDTIQLARRGAPPPPRERAVPIWITTDSMPAAAAVAAGRVSDKRIDDARVVRRVAINWPLPSQLLQKLARARAVSVVADGRVHVLSGSTVTATRTLVESIRASVPGALYSPRALLYVATFATFGIPGDSTQAEDVGTATEPLMIPDATTTPPTRVATLTVVGRGTDAIPLLVQDDGTGAAPLFGIGETVTIALPARAGRRGVVTGKIVARQRVEAFRDTCQKTKAWIYLTQLPAADLAATQRGVVASPRPTEGIDRWNGTAVREAIAARQTPAEQRQMAGSRAVVAQFAREREGTGLRERDVQILAALPRTTGFVTNFGVISKDRGGNWSFPLLSLRPATCAER